MRNGPSEAYLLCGGDSERLGFPKEMVRVDGAPLAAAMVGKLRRLFERVAVVSNHPGYLEHWLDAPVHEDAFPGLGPLAGIHTGLERTEGEGAFFLACDMPLVPEGLIRRIVEAAAGSGAPAVVARTDRGPEPLCGVYAKGLLPALAERLQDGADLGVKAFLADAGAAFVDLAPDEAGALRDVDTPADLHLLRRVFDEVQPLPVLRRDVRRIGGPPAEEDFLAAERPFTFHVDDAHLATVLCSPNALRELAVGFLSYLGLVRRYADVVEMTVQYDAERVRVKLDVDAAALRRAVQLQISSTCGATVFGPPLPEGAVGDARDPFRVRPGHILATARRLREMAPVFARTGATHQAAFTDGARVLHFEEDVGRHNAVDKVVGHCLIRGTDTSRGVLLVTGRLNSQLVVKALRQGIPVVASRSAPTAHAVDLARRHGMTLVGFARGERLNIYSAPQRVANG